MGCSAMFSVFPGFTAVTGLAECAARPPTHVGPQTGLLAIGRPIATVRHVHPWQPLHEGAAFQEPRLRVLYGPHGRVEVPNDFDGPQDERVALVQPPGSGGERPGVFGADRRGPDEVEVPGRWLGSPNAGCRSKCPGGTWAQGPRKSLPSRPCGRRGQSSPSR